MFTRRHVSHTRCSRRGPSPVHLVALAGRVLALALVALAVTASADVTAPHGVRLAGAAVPQAAGPCFGQPAFSSHPGGTSLSAAPLQRSVGVAPVHAARGLSYDWPIRPFRRQHPVRAFLDDPRGGEGHQWSFHFGIDVAAPDGTRVYAVEGGKVYFDSPRALAVVSPDGRAFGYWHIVPRVRSHQFVQRHQLLGVIADGWGHVHFAEHLNGRYVNPLRPGALTPYVDHTAPTISEVGLVRVGHHSSLVARVFDTTVPRVPGPWADEPVTPALLRWRLVSGRAAVTGWRTAADFRSFMLPASRFTTVYAPGTRQNHEGEPGHYCFYLDRGWNTRALRPGSYELEVAASDMRGNRTRATFALTVSGRS
jgi:hypothetical protein